MIPAVLLTMLTRGIAFASPLTFDFKDPKEISAVSLTIDSQLEPIVGYAKGISGTVNFDPANPKATTGRIAVTVASIQFANEGYTATARGYALNGDKYPQIFFTLRQVQRVTRAASGVYQALVRADFTCKGVTLPLTVPVTASYYPGMGEERTNGKYKGDVLVLRTQFGVSRKKLGISQGIPDSMVGDTVQIGVAVAGLRYTGGQTPPAPPPAAKEATKEAAKEAAKQAAPNKPAAPTPPAPQSASGQIVPPPAVPRQIVPPQTTASPATPPQNAARQAALPPALSLWKMEIEDRDDPTKADARLDLSAQPPTLAFTTAQGRIQADHVTLTNGILYFHLPDNPRTGEADGSAIVAGDFLRGALVTKTGRIRFHARPKRATDDAAAVPLPLPMQGPGFRDLTIPTPGGPQTLAERMRYHHVPAVSIARFENYQVVETGAFGVTSAERGAAVNADTLFQAGGMGSPLVDLLALRLAAQGRIDLNRPVNAYLKQARIPDNAFTHARPVTLLDLVNGASGLEQAKFTGYAPDSGLPTLPALMAGANLGEMQALQVTRPPGAFGGGSVGEAVLEQVLVDATGQPFARLMQDNIFAPFGMTRSAYRPDPTAPTAQQAALGHYATGELMLDRFHVYPETGASRLWTTAGDMARMLCQVQLLLADKPNRILTPAQRGLLASVLTEQWILGLRRAENNEFLPPGWLYHGGASYGYYANHATHPRNGSGVVVMENRSLGWQLNNEIIRAVGTKQGWFVPASAPPPTQTRSRAQMDRPGPSVLN